VVLQFPPALFGPPFSGPAFSGPAFSVDPSGVTEGPNKPGRHIGQNGQIMCKSGVMWIIHSCARYICHKKLQGLGKAGSGRGSADPLTFGAEVKNCIWRL